MKDPTEQEKRAATFRRLLLAKQLYQHALDHSYAPDALSKMIAVHGFHNAIEVTLKCILLHYEIKTGKRVDLSFGDLWSEIDKFDLFKTEHKNLPYGQEIRTLNTVRNLVQHHGHEPERSSMENWRVYSKSFLVGVFKEYFEESFENISSVSLIADPYLRRILEVAQASVIKKSYVDSVGLSKLAFRFASSSLTSLISPRGLTSYSFAGIRTEIASELLRFLGELTKDVGERLHRAESFAALLSSGINLVDYRRFHNIPLIYTIMGDGTPHFRTRGDISEDDAEWIHRFVTDTIIMWQQSGFSPKFPIEYHSGIDQFLKERCAAELPLQESDAERS